MISLPSTSFLWTPFPLIIAFSSVITLFGLIHKNLFLPRWIWEETELAPTLSIPCPSHGHQHFSDHWRHCESDQIEEKTSLLFLWSSPSYEWPLSATLHLCVKFTRLEIAVYVTTCRTENAGDSVFLLRSWYSLESSPHAARIMSYWSSALQNLINRNKWKIFSLMSWQQNMGGCQELGGDLSPMKE